MDVLSRYLFVYSTSDHVSKRFDKVRIEIMTEHADLQKTVISDKGSAFVSNVIKEVAGFFGITLKRANTKLSQTIGLLN